MFYLLYRVTNLINNKIYIGVHKTNDLFDGYIGSGKYLKRSISKHGVDNFKITILEFFESSELMYLREREVVNEEFLLREDAYNIKLGGQGGWDYTHKNGNVYVLTYEDRCYGGKVAGPKNIIVAKMASMINNPDGTFNGKFHSVEAKRKIGKANSEYVGDKNSQFGTMWITNEIENKKIKKEDSIPDGWRKGRVMNLVFFAPHNAQDVQPDC